MSEELIRFVQVCFPIATIPRDVGLIQLVDFQILRIACDIGPSQFLCKLSPEQRGGASLGQVQIR